MRQGCPGTEELRTGACLQWPQTWGTIHRHGVTHGLADRSPGSRGPGEPAIPRNAGILNSVTRGHKKGWHLPSLFLFLNCTRFSWALTSAEGPAVPALLLMNVPCCFRSPLEVEPAWAEVAMLRWASYRRIRAHPWGRCTRPGRDIKRPKIRSSHHPASLPLQQDLPSCVRVRARVWGCWLPGNLYQAGPVPVIQAQAK